MALRETPTPAEFMARVVGLTTLVSVSAVFLMVLYLGALLRLPEAQWQLFFRVVAGCFAFLSVTLFFVNRALFRPVLRYLSAAPGGASDELARDAFRRLCDLPRMTFAMGQGWWLLGGLLVTGLMRALDPGFALRSAAVMVAATVSGGLILMIFHYFLSKRQLAPVRLALARRLADPELREGLVGPVAVRTKLLVSVAGVTLVIVVFSLFLAETVTRRPIHAFAVRVQRALLEDLAAAGASAAGVRETEALARRLGVAEQVRLVRDEGEWRELGLADLRSAGLAAGDATGIDSDRGFVWMELPGRGTLVAVGARVDDEGHRTVFVLVGLLGVLLAAGVALVVSRDIVETTDVLRSSVERIAAGDLSRRVDFEGEDELGSLLRGFEGMTASLHTIVGQAADTADAVERAARDLAAVGGDVATVSADQREGIAQAVRSMDTIREQVVDITGAAESLSQSVEEASSSVLELGTAGEQLQGTARALTEKANVVTGSIDRMTESVRRVVESAQNLTSAADETAGGAEQMATAMSQVDHTAAETARLSSRVVEVAERGRDHVSRTISGMDAIRNTSDRVAAVIEGLGTRTQEIGAVVDVIDDVADETTLLALNAAIIAAQAGEQGRAFTVVADEIKELADRVLDNTKEISGMVHHLQSESRNASGAIAGGVESVQSGVDLAAQAGVALEEITEVARLSGEHVRGIVAAVKEQTAASSHILSLMESVRGRVEEIRRAGVQHERGNEVMRRSAQAVRDVAEQVHETTREQARGTAMIVRSVERVRDAVAEIHDALQQQGGATTDAAEFLARVYGRTEANQKSAEVLAASTAELLRQAGELRDTIRRFSL